MSTTVVDSAAELYWLNDQALSLGHRLGVSPILNAGSDGGIWISPPVYLPGHARLTDRQTWTLRRLAVGEAGRIEVTLEGHRVGVERAPDGAGRERVYAYTGDQRAEVDPAELLAFIEAWT